MQIRFMTFNIQHGIDYLKQKAKGPHGDDSQDEVSLKMMADVIREQKADIIGLNEVRGRGISPGYIAQAEEMAALLGYHCYFARALNFGGRDPYGNAILSRFPLQMAETVMIPDPPVQDEDTYYETRCVLRARFADAGGFTVLISHFGLAKSEQRSAVKTVTELLKQEKGPVVLMGDFNMEPDDPILSPLFEQMNDTAAAFESVQKSWPSDAPEIKIDYILTRGTKTLQAEIPPVTASDHRPYVALLELPD